MKKRYYAAMSLVKNTLTVGSLTMLSRIAGYVRDVLIASRLGAGVYSDAFFVAFRLPNIFRTMFAEGAFNAGFVPMFSKIKDEAAAQSFASNVFSIMFFALTAFTIVAQIFMPAFVWALASGFAENEEKFELAIGLTRITFFYLLLISLTSIFAAILNSLSKFTVAALAPLILNLTLVAALLLFADEKLVSAYAMAWGVFVAGILQLVFLYYFARRAGYIIRPQRPKIDAQTRTLFRRMIPVLIGAGVLQINVLVNTQIASYISEGAVSFLYYADRVSQLPLALIGTAMGVVLLPSLSKFLRDGEIEKSVATQNQAIWVALFLALPAAVGLGLLAEDITRVLFERGEFTESDTVAVARALQAFAFGVPAFVLAKLYTPSFYAAEDTKTPVKIAAFCIAANIFISLLLINAFGFDHLALAIATAASSWLNVILLDVFLQKKKLFWFEAQTLRKILQIAFCSALMAAAVLAANSVQISSTPAIQLFVVIGAGGVAYFASALALKTISIRTMLGRV